jgi:ATP-dependent Clp protease ATP-binding subunit ClpX
MVAVDTANILFICGGTFTGLDKIIQRRTGTHVIGFNALNIGANRKTRRDILNLVQPEDLLNFGFIPEFIGRLPVIATLDDLDEDVLIRILTEPRNALVKQMQKLFELEGVNLRFTETALKAIAHQAVLKKSGARGLRAIMEDCLLETMYDMPSLVNVRECVVDEDAVLKKKSPMLIYEPIKQQA